MPAKKKKTAKKKSKKSRKSYAVLPTRTLIRRSFSLWKDNRWRVLGLTGLYGAFYFVLVRALTAFDIAELRDVIDSVFGSESGEVGSSLVLTGAVFGLSLELDQVSGLYASILFVIFSLAYLWLLRHIVAGKLTTLKKAFYQGMYPLVPVLIIVVVMSLQLIPLSVGGYVLGTALANDIAVHLWEQILVYGFFISMLILSGYWLAGSVMAFYISTIPEMTPLKALKTAKEVLKGRRLLVLQRMLTFVLLSGLASFGLLFATIYFVEGAALVAATFLTVVAMPWLHTFFYLMYRSLIDE